MKKRWKDGYYLLRGPLHDFGRLVGLDLYLEPLPTDLEGQLSHLAYLKEKIQEVCDHTSLVHSQNLEIVDEFGRLRGKIRKLIKCHFYDF